MLIEYHLQGSTMIHKGVFDTTGFWARVGVEQDDITKETYLYKIWSHFSFTFEHRDILVVDEVWNALLDALRGKKSTIKGVGAFRPIIL